MHGNENLNTQARSERAAFARLQQFRRERIRRRLIEFYCWFLAALFMGGGIAMRAMNAFSSPIQVISEHYMEFVLATTFIIFPIIFKLIFGMLPLESLRQKYRRSAPRLESLAEVPAPARQSDALELSQAFDISNLENSHAVKLFAYYAHTSRELSKLIFSRAGVYLLIGVLVAFSGLGFFYAQTGQVVLAGDGGWQLLLLMAPKFGILFFIEIVAFFFLRQYRSAMDEFRYYEAIKRSREETLALIRMAEDMGQPINPLEWVKNQSFFSTAGVLQKGQTSEIVESRKLEKSELELLEKVLDLVARSKK